MRRFLPALFLLFTAAVALAQNREELIARGDAFDQSFQPAKALEFYLLAEKLTPDDPDLLVRMARQYRHLMTDIDDKKKQIVYGEKSIAYARRAAQLAPGDSEAQLSPAISYGKMLPLLGPKEQVRYSPLIKEAVDRALAIDPRNDTAWNILGRWQRALADVSGVKRVMAGALFGGLPKTRIEDAEKALQHAIQLNPNRVMHRVELGRVYAQMGRKAEARQELERGLALPNREHDDPAAKKTARETLRQL